MIDRLETESEVIFFAYCSPFSKQTIAGRWNRVDARSESKAIGPLQSFCTSWPSFKQTLSPQILPISYPTYLQVLNHVYLSLAYH